MQVSSISNSIISTLGNPDSRIPLAIKDVINSSGVTYFSYDAGGKFEGKDRFIDEFGTEVIWLGGLPFFKWIADKTMYKFKKLDPNVDVRVATSQDHLDFAKKVLSEDKPDEKNILNSIDDAVKRLPEFKGLFYSKFALATILTFASYYALTKYKQKTTEKALTAEILKKMANEEFFIQKSKESKQFKMFNDVAFAGKDKNAQPSFKGGLEAFMFNPVKNMLIIDAGITTERLTKSRNKQEFMEYAIKEGSLLFLLYIAGKWVKDGLEKLSNSMFKVPIDMDLRFLNSGILKEAIGTKHLDTEIEKFKKLETQKQILDFIAKYQDSTIVKGAKLSGIIKQIDGTNKIDAGAYIDTEEVKGFVSSLENFANAAKNASKPIPKFMNEARNNKIASILANMAICCTALGYVVPKLMFEYRKKNSGSTEFHVEKQVKEKLAQSFSGDKI